MTIYWKLTAEEFAEAEKIWREASGKDRTLFDEPLALFKLARKSTNSAVRKAFDDFLMLTKMAHADELAAVSDNFKKKRYLNNIYGKLSSKE